MFYIIKLYLVTGNSNTFLLLYCNELHLELYNLYFILLQLHYIFKDIIALYI